MSRTRVQLRVARMKSPNPCAEIPSTISALVRHTNGLVTLNGHSKRPESRSRKPAKTCGCVVRVARAPTTCARRGRFMLTTPFSKKLTRSRPNSRAVAAPREANRKDRVRCSALGHVEQRTEGLLQFGGFECLRGNSDF